MRGGKQFQMGGAMDDVSEGIMDAWIGWINSPSEIKDAYKVYEFLKNYRIPNHEEVKIQGVPINNFFTPVPPLHNIDTHGYLCYVMEEPV